MSSDVPADAPVKPRYDPCGTRDTPPLGRDGRRAWCHQDCCSGLRPTTVDEFGAHFGVYYDLLPFTHRTIDLVAVLADCQQAIANLPTTTATFTFQTLEPRLETIDRPKASQLSNIISARAMATLGTWPTAEDFTTARYANPHYVHRATLASPPALDDRAAHVEQMRLYTSLAWSYGDLAARWGCDTRTVRQRAQRHDIPWGEWKATGRQRLARTLATAHAWGYTHTTLATAFGMPRSTVATYIDCHAADFKPPGEPHGRWQF